MPNKKFVTMDDFFRAMDALGDKLAIITKDIADLRESQKQTDEQMKKTDEQMKKTDEQMKKTDEQMKKTDEQMKEVFSKLGDLGLLQGNIVEENICRSVQNIFKKEGKEFYDIYQNVRPKYQIRKEIGNAEYDIVAVNGTEVLVTEVKSNFRKEYVDKFLTVQLPQFTTFFPEYKGYTILGAIGGALITPQIEKFAIKNGLYVIIANEESLRLAIITYSPFFIANFSI